jgi:NAD(P)-dependent dehydrogenase (short-subunit alcohol dehydrogenase family)
VAGEAIFIQSDLTVAGAASAAVAQVVSTWGRLDCAFNNAGSAAADCYWMPLTKRLSIG